MLRKNEQMRVQKFLSGAGFCSRRQAERLMEEGRVTVNGRPVSPGDQVTVGKDSVEVDGAEVSWEVDPVYIALNKPVGVITSLDDPEGRTVVSSMLPADMPRCWPVGRLDWDSEGLVLMTNDGDLTHALTHPSTHVEKTYNIKLRGNVEHQDEGLARMRDGVTLDDGFQTASAQVTVEGHTGRHTWVQVVLHEGHNRQIRRMAEAVGHTVIKLRRVAIGSLIVDNLPPQGWRFLTRAEVLGLYTDTALTPPARVTRRSEGPLIPPSWLELQRRSKSSSKTSSKARDASRDQKPPRGQKPPRDQKPPRAGRKDGDEGARSPEGRRGGSRPPQGGPRGGAPRKPSRRK